MRQKDETNTFKIELDRFEEDKAVLFTEDSKEIILPKNLVPQKAEAGDVIFLTLTTDEAETRQREKKAKEILNEILNIE